MLKIDKTYFFKEEYTELKYKLIKIIPAKYLYELQKKDVLDKYLREFISFCNSYGEDPLDYMVEVREKMEFRYFLTYSFTWIDTKDGFNFWYDILYHG